MHESWVEKLKPLKPLVGSIYQKIDDYQKETGIITYPPKDKIFAAFDLPFEEIKVVILGQDPYPGLGQANGLAFSVNKGMDLTVSLQNIFIELQNDLGYSIPNHGDLSCWLKQGVFLLNTTLTVGAGKSNSHKDFGWTSFTEAVINEIVNNLDCIVFIAWGMDAYNMLKKFDLHKHYVIKSTHPASRDWVYKPTKYLPAFFGSKPFSECNELLRSCNKKPINWAILNC